MADIHRWAQFSRLFCFAFVHLFNEHLEGRRWELGLVYDAPVSGSLTRMTASAGKSDASLHAKSMDFKLELGNQVTRVDGLEANLRQWSKPIIWPSKTVADAGGAFSSKIHGAADPAEKTKMPTEP